MVKLLGFLFLIGSTISCAKNFIYLNDGSKNLKNRYINRKYFNNNIYDIINKDYFYIEIERYFVNSKYMKIRNISSSKTMLQFYDNGSVRFLYKLDKNPEMTGKRGIIYQRNNKLKIDTHFAIQGGSISRGAYSVKVKKDTIFLYDDNTIIKSEILCKVFIKFEKIPDEWKIYRADW